MFQDSVFFTSVWPAALTALSVMLVCLERLTRRRTLFAVISAVYCAASSVALLIAGGALCDMLLLVAVTLAVRLIFEIRDGRKTK